jgi:hypothetical protein
MGISFKFSSVRQNGPDFARLPWTSPDFYLVFVEIMPDKVILDHKKSYLVSFENFLLFLFLSKNYP